MKTKILRGWRWILALSSTVVLLGCLDQTTKTGAQTIVEPSAAAVVEKSPNDESVDKTPVRAIIPPANLSPGLAEVVKLAQSGVSEEVLLAYVEKTNHTFNPTVDEIVYLKDIGISDSVVALMVRHENATAPAAQNSSSQTAENITVSGLAQNTPAGPSLTEPTTPSYSVATESNYNEVPAAEPPQQVTINYFESALSPYGNWVEVADYGRCWQPTVVVINRNWRPYADRGRWVYTSHGWYWQSDYSWGWAPFHYGRWHNDHRIGWVWVPGSTWGPAWVSWRYTDDYCGWAPLPPSAHYVSGFGFSYYNSRVGINFGFGLPYSCYTFIPTSRFCERTPSRYYVSGSHSQTIYNNSVVINNYTRGNNNTIINEGVGRERIMRATKTPIRTVSLRELPTTSNPVGRAERLEGNSLTVFRPNISESTIPRSATQRSVATTAPVTQNTPTSPSRNLRSITKSPVSPPTSTAKVAPMEPAPTVAPIDPAPTPKTVTRTVSPSTVTRNLARPTTVPKIETPVPEKLPQRSVAAPTQPGSSEIRSLPAQIRPQTIGRSIERREISVTPAESPRTVERNISSPLRQTPIVRETQVNPVVRTTPSIPQIQPAQPTVREIRRPETPTFNPGNEQRSLRSISPSVPAPVQNFNQPREVNRGSSRIERSAPPSQPNFSAPTPSVRQSAPRQESPVQRQKVQRSVERSRSDRRN